MKEISVSGHNRFVSMARVESESESRLSRVRVESRVVQISDSSRTRRVCRCRRRRWSDRDVGGCRWQRFEVSFSMLEIYNEQVRDLLTRDNPKGGLQVRQNTKLGFFYVQNLKKVPVGSYKEIAKRMEQGESVGLSGGPSVGPAGGVSGGHQGAAGGHRRRRWRRRGGRARIRVPRHAYSNVAYFQ